ncbi:hypothetical protein Tco_0246274 [Tanacetum coccineum]
MSSVADVIEPIEQSNAITTIEESNASNHILTNLTDPTEDALKREVDFKSKEDSPKFDIGGHTLELGRIEFSLLTGFSVGKVIFPEVKAGDIPPLVRCLFLEKVPGKCKRQKGVSYNVKGRELLDFVKDDEKWKNISDVDVVRVCLLLMAEHVFMGREPNHVMGKPIMMLDENLTAWDNFPWGEYFWTEFYRRTVNLVPKNRKTYSQKLITDPLSKASYSINGFAWVLKAIAWLTEDIHRFEKQNYCELLGEGSNPRVKLTATPYENNQEWWKRIHDYFDESLSAYENVENSGNERGEYANLDK